MIVAVIVPASELTAAANQSGIGRPRKLRNTTITRTDAIILLFVFITICFL